MMKEFKSFIRALTVANQFIITDDPIGMKLKRQICMTCTFDFRVTLVIYTAGYSNKLSHNKFNEYLVALVNFEYTNISSLKPWIQEYCDKWGYSFESQYQKFKKGKGQIWSYYVLEQYVKYLEFDIFKDSKTEILVLGMVDILENM